MNTVLTLEKEDLTIYSGNKILIKGKTASGKTTLLNTIAKQLPRDQFDFLSQTLDKNFISGTVAENLAFALENHALAKADMTKQVAFIAESYGLADALETNIWYLTTYQKRCLALAQILIYPKPIILLDEPICLPDHYEGTLIVTGDFDADLFDQVVQLSDDSSEPLTPMTHTPNHDKAILSVTELIPGISFTVYEGEKLMISAPPQLPLADLLGGFLPTLGEIDFYYENITHQKLEIRGQKMGYITANPDDMIFVKRVSDASLPTAMLNLCHLDQLKERTTQQLSHRQKRQFTTACILNQDTPMLLIDQPEYEGFSELASYLDQKGITLILITDDTRFLPFMDRQEVFDV